MTLPGRAAGKPVGSSMSPWRSLDWCSLARWSAGQLSSSHTGCSRAQLLLSTRTTSGAHCASAVLPPQACSFQLSQRKPSLWQLSQDSQQLGICRYAATLRTCQSVLQQPQALLHAVRAPQALPAAEPAPRTVKAASNRRRQVEDTPVPTPPRLNAQQQAAAHSDINKPLLIIAGAGTGKTTTLIGRLYHMLQDQRIPPQNILAVTFTVKAANELRERLAKLGVRNARFLNVRTFHGMAYRLLDRNYQLAGFSQPPVVWSSDVDRKAVVREAMRRAELDKARASAVAWLQLPAGSSWADIAHCALQQYPGLYAEAEAAASETVNAAVKKKRASKKAPTEAKSLDRVRWLELEMELFDRLKQQYTGKAQVKSARLGQPPSQEKLKELFKWFQSVKSMSHTPAMYEDYPQGKVFQIYQDILQSCNAVDFDDILVLAHNIVAQNPSLLQQLQHTFQYLLVDEYQDSNPVQINFVKALMPPGGRVTAVGDDAQSIYRFRGTDSTAFRQYIDTYQHPDLQTSLTVNYRSTAPILQAAEAALQGTQTTIVPKRLTPHDNSEGRPVTLWSLEDTDAEAVEVASEIQRLHEQEDLPFKDIAVLFRAIKGNRSKALQVQLRKRGIPFTLVKEYPFLEREAVADIMSLLSLALQPDNDQAFLRMMKKPPRGLGDVARQEIERQRDAQMLSQPGQGASLFAAAQELVEDASRLGNAATLKLRAYLRMITDLQKLSETATPFEMIQAAVGSPGYLSHLQKRKVTKAAGASGIWLPPAAEEEEEEEDEETAEAYQAELLAENIGVDPAKVGSDLQLLRLLSMAHTYEEEYTVDEDLDVEEDAEPGNGLPPDMPPLERLQAELQAARERAQALAKEAVHGQQALREFMATIALDESVGEEARGVTVGTIHSAKGLEWDTVFVVRCNEDILPMTPWLSPTDALKPKQSASVLHSLPPAEEDHEKLALDMEQEHRLVYVALTRARQRLYLTSLRCIVKYGKREMLQPADFLKRIRQQGPAVCKTKTLYR